MGTVLAALVMTMLTLSTTTRRLFVVSMVWWLCVRVVRRIVVSVLSWIVLARMLRMTMHRRRHTSVHMHLAMLWRIIGWVLWHGRALVIALFFLLLLVDWVHAVHLVSLTFVVLLLFGS